MKYISSELVQKVTRYTYTIPSYNNAEVFNHSFMHWLKNDDKGHTKQHYTVNVLAVECVDE